MKSFILLLFLILGNAIAQDSYEPDLEFLKNPNKFREAQNKAHEQLSQKILNDIPMMSNRYSQMRTFLHYNKPQIITQEVEFTEEEIGGKKVLKPGQIYFVWGYNRAFHGNSDMTYSTSEGTFTVHDAQGVDRPSPFDPKIYFNPTTLSIPQYVVKVGYMFDEKWGVELSQDHMKWVFVNDATYEVSGDFSPTVYVTEEGQQWPVAQNFDQIKESGNMTWLTAEHSDGYNYVNVSAVYNLKVFETKNEVFRIDLRPNAGFGLMVPKTKVMMHRDQMWSWQGLDNKFHIAGFGAHVETKLRLTFFRNFFVEAAARGTYIKINDALVNGTNDRMWQTAIPSLQLYGAAGFSIPIGGSKKKKSIKKFD
jgi:hypothetical protein